MLRSSLLLIALLVLSLPATAQTRAVTVNGEALDSDLLTALEDHYNVRIEDGAYWYDPESGAWGLEGQPTSGIILARLALGGALQENASRGRTQVWVNGRRLPTQDLRALEALTGPIDPGRYWLDAAGNAGPEGGAALVNLYQLARQVNRGGVRRSWITGIGSNSSGGSGYVMGKDWSVSY